MSKISTTPWRVEEPNYEYGSYLYGSIDTKKRRISNTITLTWTADVSGNSAGTAPETGYDLVNGNGQFIPDERFKYLGLPEEGPSGVWMEIWYKIGPWYFWDPGQPDGGAWVLLH